MTPLSGTKNPSAPVGDKSGGDRKAARSLLSCALWRGTGRLWRGMGGMGRAEPLAAHHPRQQQGLSGFHETRITEFGRPVTASLFTIVHHCSAKNVTPEPAAEPRRATPSPTNRFSRITRHESRITAFFRITAFVLGRLWRGMGGILPPRRSPPFTPPSGLVPPRRTPNEPMPRKGNVLDCANESTLYMTMTPDRTASLHFSPRGEAKCVRGPSGLGASRAEEKGASRLARAGVLDSTLSTASKRNEVLAVVSRASTVGW